MSNFGSFNFNISKATPTTSTTNANTTSLPVSSTPRNNSSKVESTVSSKVSSLEFLKTHKTPSEASSDVGNCANTGTLDNLATGPTIDTKNKLSGQKEDLINLFEKFDINSPKNSCDIDSMEKKFAQSKGSIQKRPNEDFDLDKKSGDVNKNYFSCCNESESVSSENIVQNGLVSREKIDSFQIEQNPSKDLNQDKGEQENEPNTKENLNKTINSQKVPHINSMMMQPYIIDEEVQEAASPVTSSDKVQNEVEAEMNNHREDSPSPGDFLTMDNSEPVQEVQLEMSEKREYHAQHNDTESSSQRPQTNRNNSIVKASRSIVNASEQYQQSHRPFDFQTFLSHLRNKNADPIVRYIRSFLMSFARQASTMSVTQMMKAVKNFKLFIEGKFHVYEPFASMDAADVENSIEGVEKLIMNRIYEFCFPPEASKKSLIRSPSSAMSKDLSDDETFSNQVEKFSWISGPHLDVDLESLSEKKKKASRDNIDHMEYAAKELNKINNYRAPRDKIICILNACKILFSLLRVTDQETNADAFIPLLILVIIKAKTKNIISNLHYIERFRGENWLNHGETSYYLSTMQGAISFIQNIKRGDLTIDETHFAAHMEAWEAEVRQRSRDEPDSRDNVSETPSSVSSPQRQGILPSNVLLASAEMLTKSISSFIAPAEEVPDSNSTGNSERQDQIDFTEVQVDETFSQLSEIFPSLDKDIMRDIIVMNKADFEGSLEVCLQLVNDM